jgi:glutamyl/glutaminyl-tRNA synthetase
LIDRFNNLKTQEYEKIIDLLIKIEDEIKIKKIDLLKFLRIIITGKENGPSIAKIIETIETEEIIKRINYYINN